MKRLKAATEESRNHLFKARRVSISDIFAEKFVLKG